MADEEVEVVKPVNQIWDELTNNYNFGGVNELTNEEVEDFYALREVVNA